MHVIKRILVYCREYAWLFVIGLLCSAVAAVCTIYPAYIMKSIVNDVLVAKDLVVLNWIALSVIVVMFIKGITGFCSSYLMVYVAQTILKNIRNQCFDKLSELSLSFYEKQRTGQLMSRVTSDVSVLQSLVNDFTKLVSDMIQLVGFCSYIFYLHWKLAFLSIIIIPFIGFIISRFSKRMKMIGSRTQGRIGDLATVLQEFITGIKVIKTFTLEKFIRERFVKANDASFKEIMRGNRINAATTPVIEFINSCGLALIFWYGGREVVAGNLDAGQVVSFLTALVGLFTPIRDLSRMSNSISMAVGAGERVFEIIDAEVDIQEKENPLELEHCKGSVEFKNVTFFYKKDKSELVLNDKGEQEKQTKEEQRYVLKDVDFKITPGEAVALVGPSGAGKSTFVNLIPRLFDVKGGSIEIDGVDVREFSFASMRRHIAMVPQDTLLFSGTIKDNIRFGRLDAEDHEIIEAAKLANAHGFILEQPEAYETILGERGVNLSGGQAQRIALARAFLKDPAILILDEATSALDSGTESQIKESLNLLMKGRTTFMIAHRLSTVVNSDKILVLNNGGIAEVGKHQELLDKNGLYADLYHSQHGGRQNEEY
jgi:subfamily B ATP-binding cassette protein MsbA